MSIKSPSKFVQSALKSPLLVLDAKAIAQVSGGGSGPNGGWSLDGASTASVASTGKTGSVSGGPNGGWNIEGGSGPNGGW